MANGTHAPPGSEARGQRINSIQNDANVSHNYIFGRSMQRLVCVFLLDIKYIRGHLSFIDKYTHIAVCNVY